MGAKKKEEKRLKRLKEREEMRAQISFRDTSIFITNQNEYDWKGVEVELRPEILLSRLFGFVFHVEEIRSRACQQLDILKFRDFFDRIQGDEFALRHPVKKVKITSKSPRKSWESELETPYEMVLSVEQTGEQRVKELIEGLVKPNLAVETVKDISIVPFNKGYRLKIEYKLPELESISVKYSYGVLADIAQEIFRIKEISYIHTTAYQTLQDIYGQESEEAVVWLGVSRQTNEKINWRNIISRYEVYHQILDEHRIHPALQKYYDRLLSK